MSDLDKKAKSSKSTSSSKSKTSDKTSHKSSTDKASSDKKSSSTTPSDKKKERRSSTAKETPIETKSSKSTTEPTADDGKTGKLLAEKDTIIKKLQDERDRQQKEIEEIKKQLAQARASSGVVVEEEDNSTEITYEPKKGKKVRINGEWKGVSAGGCMDHLTWRYNPQIFFTPSRSATINFTLTQINSGSPVGMGFYIFECPQETARRILVDDKLQVGKSKFQATATVEGSFTIKKSKNPFVIIPATLDTEIEMKFTMTIACADAPVTAQLISKQQEWPLPTILGEWVGETAGGCHNNDTVVNNPQYLLKVTAQAKVRILLLQSKFGPDDDFDNIGFYLIQVEADRKQKIVDTNLFEDEDKVLINPTADMADSNEYSGEKNLKPGSYAIVPCTFDAGQESSFQLMIMTDIDLPPVTELIDAAVISINGSWEGEEAGGCLNDIRLWRANRQYALFVDKDIEITLKIKQTSSVASDLMSVGFYVFKGGKRVIKAKKDRLLRKSKFGKKREGISEKLKLTASAEPYVIVPCTFDPFVEGTYSLSVLFKDASEINDVRLEPLPEEWDFDYLCEHGEWKEDTAGGCLDFSTWRNNPQFLLEVSKNCDLTVFLSCLTDKDNTTPGFYVVKAPTNMVLNVNVKKEDILFKAQFTQAKEVSKSMNLTPGRYNIIPCTYTTGVECKFEISIFCSVYGALALSPIKTGFLTLDGEWTKENAGGCINDMKSWLNNPKFFLAVKQQTEIAAVLVQNPAEAIPEDLNSLLEIGMYITNSDGDGNAKTNEASDLISKADFSPDKDVVAVVDLPACHYPYVITPCTFKPGFVGKFRIYVLLDHANLEYIEFSKNPMNINPSEVVGAGENPRMREIRRRFKPLASQTVELVKLTESPDLVADGIPEFMNYIGRQLLGKVAEYQASIVAWGDGVEPQWWLDGYDEPVANEEVVEEKPVEEVVETVDEPMMKKSTMPPPKRQPAINFSKAVKSQMIDTNTQSGMTQEMIEELEAPKERLVVDSLLASIKGGLKALRKVEIPPKPIVQDPLACAFNMEVLNKRRAVLEGLDDHNDDADEWSVEDD